MIKKFVKENYIYLIAIIILIIAFMFCFKFGIKSYIYQFDNNVINYISQVRNPFATKVLIIITNLGDWYIPFIILVLLLIISNDNRKCFSQTFSYIVSGVVAFISKILISRPRPEYTLIEVPDAFSFPSGHALTSIVFYFMLWYILFYKKKGINKIISLLFFILLLLLIGFSRIYLGVHYFSDVIGGILFAIPCIFISKNIVKNFMR